MPRLSIRTQQSNNRQDVRLAVLFTWPSYHQGSLTIIDSTSPNSRTMYLYLGMMSLSSMVMSVQVNNKVPQSPWPCDIPGLGIDFPEFDSISCIIIASRLQCSTSICPFVFCGQVLHADHVGAKKKRPICKLYRSLVGGPSNFWHRLSI